MFKSYFRSFIYTMGVVSILFIILSLIWSDAINIKHLYHMISVPIPVHLFSFFTFELKLFSKHIWIRRMVVIAFSLLVLFVGGYISGSGQKAGSGDRCRSRRKGTEYYPVCRT